MMADTNVFLTSCEQSLMIKSKMYLEEFAEFI